MLPHGNGMAMGQKAKSLPSNNMLLPLAKKIRGMVDPGPEAVETDLHHPDRPCDPTLRGYSAGP